MRSFETLSLTMVLAVAGALSGCDRQEDKGWDSAAQPTRVCVDQQGKRVPENECATQHTGVGVSPFLWYYLGTLGRGSYAPSYGGMVTGGSYRASPGVSYGAAPAAGGIVRGGFGGTAHSFGGLGGEGAGE